MKIAMKTKLNLTLTAMLLVLALGSKAANAVNITVRAISQVELADEALANSAMSLTREQALDLVQRSGEEQVNAFHAEIRAFDASTQTVKDEIKKGVFEVSSFRQRVDESLQRMADAVDVLSAQLTTLWIRRGEIELSEVNVNIGKAKRQVQAEYDRSAGSTEMHNAKERDLSKLETLWRSVVDIYNNRDESKQSGLANREANHKFAAALEHFTSPEMQTILLNAIDFQYVGLHEVSLQSAKDYAQYINNEQERAEFIASIDAGIAVYRSGNAHSLKRRMQGYLWLEYSDVEIARAERDYAAWHVEHYGENKYMEAAAAAVAAAVAASNAHLKDALANLPKFGFGYAPSEQGYRAFAFTDNTGAYGTHSTFGISKNGLGLILNSNDTLSMVRTYVTYSPLKGLDTRLQVGVIKGKGRAEGAKANELQLGINYNLPKAGVQIRSGLTENSLTGTSANIQLGISW